MKDNHKDTQFENIDYENNLNHIANMEAATDIIVEDDALLRQAALYNGQTASAQAANMQATNGNSQSQGVTSNAPYKNIAKYKMITGEFGDDMDADAGGDNATFDSQGS